MKRQPTGFVARCQCGAIVGALDYDRTDRKEAGVIMGKWLADGCTVEPRFGESWSERLESCRCDKPAPKPETDRDARKLAERILQIADDLQDKWDGGDHADMFDKVTERYIDKIAALIQSHDAALLASHGQGERALREALEQAAQSLEAIGRLAGKDEALLENDQVRGYAINRAAAARAALGQSAGDGT